MRHLLVDDHNKVSTSKYVHRIAVHVPQVRYISVRLASMSVSSQDNDHFPTACSNVVGFSSPFSTFTWLAPILWEHWSKIPAWHQVLWLRFRWTTQTTNPVNARMSCCLSWYFSVHIRSTRCMQGYHRHASRVSTTLWHSYEGVSHQCSDTQVCFWFLVQTYNRTLNTCYVIWWHVQSRAARWCACEHNADAKEELILSLHLFYCHLFKIDTLGMINLEYARACRGCLAEVYAWEHGVCIF